MRTMIPTKMTLKFSALSCEVDSDVTELSSLIKSRGSAGSAARGVLRAVIPSGF